MTNDEKQAIQIKLNNYDDGDLCKTCLKQKMTIQRIVEKDPDLSSTNYESLMFTPCQECTKGLSRVPSQISASVPKSNKKGKFVSKKIETC